MEARNVTETKISELELQVILETLLVANQITLETYCLLCSFLRYAFSVHAKTRQ